MKKFTYIFVRRNMGNGYAEAYPPCSWIKSFVFNHFLLPLASKTIEKTIAHQTEKDLTKNFASGFLSNVEQWHGYYVAKFEKKPDIDCTDPLAKGRCPVFSAYLIFEGRPQVLPLDRFDTYVHKCIDTAYGIHIPGENALLKIEIPDEFFEREQ